MHDSILPRSFVSSWELFLLWGRVVAALSLVLATSFCAHPDLSFVLHFHFQVAVILHSPSFWAGFAAFSGYFTAKRGFWTLTWNRTRMTVRFNLVLLSVKPLTAPGILDLVSSYLVSQMNRLVLDTDPPGELAHDDLAPNVGISFPALSGAQFDVHSTSGTPASIPAGSGLDPVLPHFPSSRTDMQPTVPVHVHEASFARALLSNCSTTDIVLPCETPFYKELFGDEPFSQSLVPEMPIGALCSFGGEPGPQEMAQTVAAVASFTEGTPVFSACVASTDDGPFHAVQSKLHNVAVQKLLTVLRHDLNSSETGRHILALGDDWEQLQGAHKIVEAVLGTRAPSTLVKRANSLLSYLRWFDRMNRFDLDPFSEECIWMYLQQLRESGAPCTKGSSALSAFRFAFHLLGFTGLGPALNSRRLIGVCELMLSQKRPFEASIGFDGRSGKGFAQVPT